jgi:hypothetical protein
MGSAPPPRLRVYIDALNGRRWQKDGDGRRMAMAEAEEEGGSGGRRWRAFGNRGFTVRNSVIPGRWKVKMQKWKA